MIRKYIIVVLVLAAAGTILLWVESYRPSVASRGTWKVPGRCVDFFVGIDRGFHTVVQKGGVCIAYRYTVKYGNRNRHREFKLTRNLKYSVWYPHFQECRLNKKHGYSAPQGRVFEVHTVCLPLWLLLVLFAAYPTVTCFRGLRPWRQQRRQRQGLCLNCAYDLTGNESGVCPECGTEVRLPVSEPDER